MDPCERQMKSNQLLIALIVFGSLICAAGFAVIDGIAQQKKVRRVVRVARPTFEENNWQDIYFEDVDSALVGARPEISEPEAPTVAANESESSTSTGAWSDVVSSSTLEDEAKSLVQKLNTTLTSPVKFKTSYTDVNQIFSELALVFAIIQQYDGDVRWKDDAPNALAAMQRAAVNSRNSSDASYEYCNLRKFELTDLIRGENYPQIETPSETIDWTNVIDRSPSMIRLQISDDQIKQWTAAEDEFESNTDKIFHEAQWVSAIARVIAMEDMDDTDDDGYLEFCGSMEEAAKETVDAVKLNDYGRASKYANLMSQSCSNCHEEWK